MQQSRLKKGKGPTQGYTTYNTHSHQLWKDPNMSSGKAVPTITPTFLKRKWGKIDLQFQTLSRGKPGPGGPNLQLRRLWGRHPGGGPVRGAAFSAPSQSQQTWAWCVALKAGALTGNATKRPHKSPRAQQSVRPGSPYRPH